MAGYRTTAEQQTSDVRVSGLAAALRRAVVEYLRVHPETTDEEILSAVLNVAHRDVERLRQAALNRDAPRLDGVRLNEADPLSPI